MKASSVDSGNCSCVYLYVYLIAVLHFAYGHYKNVQIDIVSVEATTYLNGGMRSEVRGGYHQPKRPIKYVYVTKLFI